MTDSPSTRLNPLHVAAAFGTGCLLTLMVHFNGELARHGNALFSSWTAHGTGTVAALVFLGLFALRRRPATVTIEKPKAPWWAYLGGLSGAITVILTSMAVNSPLALSGTLALGLAGQVVFGLAADRWGLLGMPRRRIEPRDLAALALILAGSALIIFFGMGGA